VLVTLWRTYRPPAADLILAAAFIALGQAVTWARLDDPWAFEGPRTLNAVLNLMLMSALAWRRRAPFGAVCWAVGVYYLPHAIAPHDLTLLAGFLPLIVLTASAGYFCPRRRAVMAAAVAVVAITVATLTTVWLRSPDAFAYNAVVLLLPWLMARGLREREDKAAKLAAALARERAAKEAAVREVASQERARIARELHDIVAHSVSVMVVQIGAARMQLRAGAPAAAAPLLDAEDVGREALADLRRLLGVLRAEEATGQQGQQDSPQAPQPGLAQLDALVAQFGAAGIRVEVNVAGCEIQLPPVLDLTAYRIVQEALTNTLKHTTVASARVRLEYTPSSLMIDVTDEGVGPFGDEPGGHGLIGIRERASLFGGTATAGAVEGGGWRVHAELPLCSPAADKLSASAVSTS
jgi:signal transduction histidine kinase